MEDINVYGHILNLTNVRRVNYSNNGKVRSHRRTKYKNVISLLSNTRNPNIETHDMMTYHKQSCAWKRIATILSIIT